MQIYYSSIQAIQQQTLQLDNEQCVHCKQNHQLVSHGFIHKKRVGAEPEAVGKRVLCSNRNRRTGCGRTVQLYLDSTIRYLHYAAWRVETFLFALMAGITIQRAYYQATGANAPRNAYLWLNKLSAQLSCYRSLSHQPLLPHSTQAATENRYPRRGLLISTVDALLRQWGQPLCAGFQLKWQRSFV